MIQRQSNFHKKQELANQEASPEQQQQQMETLDPLYDAQSQTKSEKLQRIQNDQKKNQSKVTDHQKSEQDLQELNQMLQFLRISGEGSFAKVEIVVDYQSGSLLAIKKFNESKHYIQEKKIYNELLDDFLHEQDKLNQLAVLPKNFDDSQNAIYFTPGVCSLDQLSEKTNFVLTANQAVNVFTTLLEFLMMMKEKGYCHFDIKPANTQLFKCEDRENAYVLKVIDFGGVTKNSLQCSVYSPAFFNSPNRYYNQNKFLVFKSMEERFKNEFYSVIRTTQYLFLNQNEKHLFSLGSDFNQNNRLNKLKQIQIYVNQQYQNKTQDHLLNEILDFILLQGLEEKFDFKELENLLKYLKDNMTDQQKYFQDTQNAINEIAQKQLTKIKQRADPLALLFGLNSFINQIGSYSELYQDQYDLITCLKLKLQENSAKMQSLVVIGESGAGKTLLLIKLMQELKESKLDDDIALINLRDLSNLDQEDNNKYIQDLCNKIQQQITSSQKQHKKENLILLLDGYDELNNKNWKISDLIYSKYQNYNKIKILITTRPRYANDVELNEAFSKPVKIYICPFNRDQITNYIENFLRTYQKYKDYMPQFESLQTTEDYLEILGESYSLDQLCSLPFTLSLVIFMIPILKEKMKQQKKQERIMYTKYNLYEIFVQDYQKKRIQSLYKDDKYEVKCLQKYGQQDFIEQIVTDTEIFNQKCSWQMLKNQKLELGYDELQIIFNEIQAIYGIQLFDIVDLLQQISPTAASNSKAFSYMHKSFYEFYIAQSIIDETLNADCQAIDENKTMLSKAFLRFDLDILTFISEHVMEMPVYLQYSLFFETWYRSVVLTRKIKTENITDLDRIDKLEKIGSNCVNLLAGPYRCDLTYRDFSECAIPYAYFYKRDLSGCLRYFFIIIKLIWGRNNPSKRPPWNRGLRYIFTLAWEVI